MFLYSPTYMNRVLHLPVHQSGLSSALPPLAQFAIKIIAGFTSDKVGCLSETNKLRAYNSIAFFGCATFMTILAFFPTDLSFLCLLLFGASAGVLGFTTGGFFKAGPLVSKHFSHFVTGNISLGERAMCRPISKQANNRLHFTFHFFRHHNHDAYNSVYCQWNRRSEYARAVAMGVYNYRGNARDYKHPLCAHVLRDARNLDNRRIFACGVKRKHQIRLQLETLVTAIVVVLSFCCCISHLKSPVIIHFLFCSSAHLHSLYT